MRKLQWKVNDKTEITFKDNKDSLYYYNSKHWKNLRNRYYTAHPICEECFAKGVYRPAQDIHHIKPFMTGKSEDQRWTLLLDENNLQALCKEHHLTKHSNNDNKPLSSY